MTSDEGRAVSTPPIPAEAVLPRMLSTLEAKLDPMVETAVEAIFTDLAAYRDYDHAAFREDVRRHVAEHYERALRSFREHRPIAREDLSLTRRHAAARVGHISVADFIGAFQIGQRVLWNETHAVADDEPSRAAALRLVEPITRYFEVATTHAAEVYLEAELLLATTGERLRRDALEDLLSGSPHAVGRHEATLRESGLGPRGECVVITAVPVAAPDDEDALHDAASALSRALRLPVAPLVVLRHQEVVIVAPAPVDLTDAAQRIACLQRALADEGTTLAAAMSTIHQGLDAVAEAYREAAETRSLLGEKGGFAALPLISTFEYLTMRIDPTARRLVRRAVERFVAEDLAGDGIFVATLKAYAAANLNVKQAAIDLHVHPNTAHYRLGKIAERTGTDLRQVEDVIELLIAVRLAAR